MKKNGMKRALAWVALAMVLAGGCAAQQSGFGNLQPSTAPYQPFAPPYDCLSGQQNIKVSITQEELEKPRDLKDMQRLTMVAFAFANKILPDKTDKDATELYQIAADGGNAFAQYELGFRYWNGKSVPENPELAVQYFKKSASQGYCSSKALLGRAYIQGIGVKKDVQQGIRYMDEAARMGNKRALDEMGWRYKDGAGVPRSETKATAYFKWAAEQGYAESQYVYGVHLMKGIGVAKDEAAGAEWQLKAAEQNEPNAQFETAMNYIEGVGVAKDFAKGVEWLKKGAGNGNRNSQYFLGLFALNSNDPKDHEYGIQYLERAAKQGDEKAMLRLGQWMAANKKSGEDLTQALAWLLVSRKNPNLTAKADGEISALKSRLNPGQVQGAESRASNFKAKKE